MVKEQCPFVDDSKIRKGSADVQSHKCVHTVRIALKQPETRSKEESNNVTMLTVQVCQALAMSNPLSPPNYRSTYVLHENAKPAQAPTAPTTAPPAAARKAEVCVAFPRV